MCGYIDHKTIVNDFQMRPCLDFYFDFDTVALLFVFDNYYLIMD